MTDIDEKLTTLDQLLSLLEAGHVLLLRKGVMGFRIASATHNPDGTEDSTSPTTILLEGLPFAEDWKIEAATGRDLASVVRGVVTLHDLPC